MKIHSIEKLFNFKNKIILISGTSGLLGESLARLFLDLGSIVIGFDVKDNNQKLGTILKIQENKVQALFEVQKKNGSISLIPIHNDFILEVNRIEKYIEVKIPEGLLDL